MPIKTLSDLDTVIINNDIYFKATEGLHGVIEGTIVEILTIKDSEGNVKQALVLKDVSVGDYSRTMLNRAGMKVRIIPVSQ